LFVGVLVIGVVAFTSTVAWSGPWSNKHEGMTVKLDQLPAAAKEIILKEAGSYKIEAVHEFDRGASKVFSARWMADGMTTRLCVVDTGKVLSKAVETKLDLLPAAVKDNAQKLVGDAKIREIESITRPDGKACFEFEYLYEGRNAQLRLDPNGMVLFHSVIKDVRDVPTAVRDTVVKEAATNVKVKTVVEITKGAETYYLGWWNVDGKCFKVQVNPDGVLAATYRETTIGELPALAKDALLKEAGDFKIVGVHEITKGTTKEFQAIWYVEGRRMAFDVTPEGKPIGTLHELDLMFGAYHGELG